MNCPICDTPCVLYKAVHEWHCVNCGWEESVGSNDTPPDDDYDDGEPW